MLQFSCMESGDDICANPWVVMYINLERVLGMLSGTEVFSDCYDFVSELNMLS